MKMRFSISFKLMAFILPLICLPIATVGYFSFQASVDRVDRLVRQEQMVQVKAIAGEINEIFFYCQLDLKTIAGLPVLEDYLNARAFRLNIEAEFNHDNIVRLFDDFIGRATYYFQIRYIGPDGRELIKVRRDEITAALSDQSDESFFLKAREAGKEEMVVSNITPSSARNGFVIYWAKAIYSGLGEFAGVVVIDLDYERIIRIVKNIHVDGRGYAFLIDALGRVIAHPRFEPLAHHLENTPDPSLKELILEMMTGASGWKPYTFEEESKVAAFAPIPFMNWSLAVTLPSREFRKEAIAIRAKVVQAVVITLLFAVTGVSVLTYYLLKPVRALVDATKRIAEGDLEHEIPLQSTDELGDLTSAFNRMVWHLNRTKNELVRSEKLIALGRLSAGVAHEVRNPLNAMKGAIVYLQRQRAGDALVGEYTQLVSEEIDRLSQFVSEFLCFARQSVPKPEPTDINRLIYATQNLFEKEALERGIRLHNQLATDLPVAAVDPHQMEQVLMNVLMNAMDALPNGGDITFSSRLLKGQADRADTPWVRVTVEDNGIGISADHLKSIFDPFFSTKDAGTGLGLPISLGVVENHGGHIRITSQEGMGTAVIIEWPFKAGITEGV
ncbi:MAG: cache domain-containing protein [Pseudomonadota bacterium]